MEGLLGWLRRFEAQPSVPVFEDPSRPTTFQSTQELEDGTLDLVNTTLRVNYMSLFPHLIAVSRDAELDIGKLEDFVQKKKTLPELLYSGYSPFGRPFDQLALQELRTAFELKAASALPGGTKQAETSDDFVRYIGPRKRIREEAIAVQAEKRARTTVPSPGPAKSSTTSSRSRPTSPTYAQNKKSSPLVSSSSPAYRRSSTPGVMVEDAGIYPPSTNPAPVLPPRPSVSHAPLPPGPPPPPLPPPASSSLRPSAPLPPGPPPSQQSQLGDEMMMEEEDADEEEDFELKANGHNGGEIVPPQVKKAMKATIKALINIKDWPLKGQKMNPFAVKLVRGQKNSPVPDQYFERIKRPMDLSTIKERVDEGFYANFQQFALDVRLVAENALEWNLPNSATYPLAEHLKRRVEKELNSQRANLNGHF